MIKKLPFNYTQYMFLLTGCLVAVLAACEDPADCHAPSGHWSDKEGRELVFLEAGKALWLTRFGSQADTQTCNYIVDCSQEPASIDLSNFDKGPFKDKNLLGILEWSADTSFRWQYDVAERPHQFDVEAAIKMYRVKH